jgi:lysophospholipid acyltransferase (LPLAT)-like uncharacterized protein
VAVAAALGAILVRLLGSTWRMSSVHRDGFDALRAKRQPVVIALWHGELLPLLWQHRDEGIAILISTHADGEIITRIALSLGNRAVRGSSSRGGARALLELAGQLQAGFDVAVTPDGPRGPRRVFAAGAVVAAMRAGAPIVALGATVDRYWRLRSWDRLVIPKPFARITVKYSEPTYVDATSPRGAEAETPRFQALLMGVSAPDED